MIDNCMSGYNSCMFAYGQVREDCQLGLFIDHDFRIWTNEVVTYIQTGSGKTHTMLGDIDELEHRPSDNRGITPRIFEYLFRRIVIVSYHYKQLKLSSWNELRILLLSFFSLSDWLLCFKISIQCFNDIANIIATGGGKPQEWASEVYLQVLIPWNI